MTHTVSRAMRGGAARLFIGGLFAFGCSNVLGIHDPTPRDPEAQGGEAGEPPANGLRAGGDAGGAMNAGTGGASGEAGLGAIGPGGTAGGEAGAGGEATSGSSGIAGIGANGTSGAETGGGGTGGVGGATGGTSGGGYGGGGSGGAPACVVGGPLRCDPASPKTPQVCSDGQWVTNAAQNSGQDCPVACNDGLCGECSNGDVSCKGNYPRTCVNGAWVKQAFSCPDRCFQGACVTAPSCAGVAAPGSCNQESCCLSLDVTGGSFFRDGKSTYPATISSFTMDKYEVTVARLKKYLTWYFGLEGSAPLVATGKATHIAADPGWSSSYPLPARTPQGMQDMQDMLSCVATHGDPADVNATYPADNPLLPANCVSFYVAYALCVWDGGRLPTEAEWNFAATSSEQRTYPWSNPPASTLINATYAVYANNPLQPVGSLLPGAGPFGQLDLSGNVSEWTLDYFNSSYPTTPCVDCINLNPVPERSLRGGAFQFSQLFVRTSSRGSLASDMSRVFAGFRCVHDL